MAIELKMYVNNKYDIIGYRPGLKNRASKQCLLIAPGLPQYFDKYHPFLNTVIQLGIDVFIIRYSGSRENSGLLSIDQAKKNINDALDFIHGGKGQSIFDNTEISFNYQKIFLLGFSFGGLPTIFSNYFPDVQKILCCPFINYSRHIDGGGENLAVTFDFLSKGYPNLYNFEEKGIIKELQTINYNSSDKQSQYILITGKHDTAIPKNEIDRLVQNYLIKNKYNLEMGHSINIPSTFLLEIFQN